MTYGVDLIYQEISYIAYRLHWPLDDLLDLEHADRRRYLAQVQRLDTQH